MKHFCLPFPLLMLSIIVWQLFTSTVYAQWSTDPNVNNAICTEINDQTEPTIVSDGSGGAIIVWTDYRAGTYSDIYAQRIDANGILQMGD